MSVSCECCVLSGRGLCFEPITSPEESYRVWCVSACDRETSTMRWPWPTGGCFITEEIKLKISFGVEAESCEPLKSCYGTIMVISRYAFGNE